MTLRTKLFESMEEAKKNLRGQPFEIHYPNLDWQQGFPEIIEIRVHHELDEPTVGRIAVYRKHEEWLNKRLYRIFYVREV